MSETTTRLLKETKCPYCGTTLQAATPANVRTNDISAPKEGDISVCFTCGELSRFDENLDILPVPVEELPTLLAEFPELNTICKAIINMKRRGIRG